jgi:hypothetical protein
MELCFYNAVLGGMSCDGMKFAYTNQLASCEKDLCERKEWFTCACCPPNVSRLLGSLGGYMWDFETDKDSNSATIRVHMFGSAAVSFKLGNGEAKLMQKSDWPWDGNIDFSFEGPNDASVAVHIRIPSWANGWKVLWYKYSDLGFRANLIHADNTPANVCNSFNGLPLSTARVAERESEF